MLIGNLVKRVAGKKCTGSDRDEWYHSKQIPQNMHHARQWFVII